MLRVSELFIYPIKSLGGFPLAAATVTDRGFQYDRRWMLIDENNGFLTQREFHEMALLAVSVTEGGLMVRHKKHHDAGLMIPFETDAGQKQAVTIWSDRCQAQFVSPEADAWFSEVLSTKCRLVYMPDETRRRVDTRYAAHKEVTSFSDGYPFLIIGQSSLDDLNSRLQDPLPMDRFRPNIVFTGGAPYEEDQMNDFQIGPVRFFGVKLSARCVITTIDQQNAHPNKEPLPTLASYRKKNGRIYFGQNLLHTGEGQIRVGDVITKTQQRVSNPVPDT